MSIFLCEPWIPRWQFHWVPKTLWTGKIDTPVVPPKKRMVTQHRQHPIIVNIAPDSWTNHGHVGMGKISEPCQCNIERNWTTSTCGFKWRKNLNKVELTVYVHFYMIALKKMIDEFFFKLAYESYLRINSLYLTVWIYI